MHGSSLLWLLPCTQKTDLFFKYETIYHFKTDTGILSYTQPPGSALNEWIGIERLPSFPGFRRGLPTVCPVAPHAFTCLLDSPVRRFIARRACHERQRRLVRSNLAYNRNRQHAPNHWRPSIASCWCSVTSLIKSHAMRTRASLSCSLRVVIQ